MLIIFAGLVGGAVGSWLALANFKPCNLLQMWRRQSQKPGPLDFKVVEYRLVFLVAQTCCLQVEWQPIQTALSKPESEKES
jgi:hypothetical protein